MQSPETPACEIRKRNTPSLSETQPAVVKHVAR